MITVAIVKALTYLFVFTAWVIALPFTIGGFVLQRVGLVMPFNIQDMMNTALSYVSSLLYYNWPFVHAMEMLRYAFLTAVIYTIIRLFLRLVRG